MIKIKSSFGSGLLMHHRGLSQNFRGVVIEDVWYKSTINPKGYAFSIVNSYNNFVDEFYIADFEERYNEILYTGREFRLWTREGFILVLTEEEFQDELKKQEEERNIKEKQLEDMRKKDHQRRLEESLKIKNESDEFYESLTIPVKYTPVYMIVGSGLIENSAGNGANKSTVTHLRVDDNLDDGKRFKRISGHLLCNQKRKGRRTFWIEESKNSTLDGEEYYNKVTCKSCLKILMSKGWIKDNI